MKSLETDNNNHGPGARLDSSCQLSLHHDLILPSDEGTEESLGEQQTLKRTIAKIEGPYRDC